MSDTSMMIPLSEIVRRIREGLPLDDMDFMADMPVVEPARPACEECEGLGYVRYDVPVGDPRFGKLFPCPNPNCTALSAHRRVQVDEIMRYSTWEQDYSSITFDSFVEVVNRLGDAAWQGKVGAFVAAKMFSRWGGQHFTMQAAARFTIGRDWPNDDGFTSNSVVLTGDVGTGKTGLAIAATNCLREQDKPVIFIRTLDLIKHVQETYAKDYDGEPTDSRIRRYARVPFLMLDEFGIEAYTSDRKEIVETLIRERDRAGLPFLVTTNLSIEQVYEMKGWDKRIADVVAKAHWINVGGVKLRQTSRKAKEW